MNHIAHRSYYSPFVSPLLAVIVGIALQDHFHIPASLLTIGIVASVLVGGIGWYLAPARFLRITTLLTVGICGALSLWSQQHKHTLLLESIVQQKITIIGTIIDKHEWGQRLENHTILVRAHELFFPTTNTHYHQSCDFLCYLRGRTKLMVGDIITIEQCLIKPPQPSTTGNRTYADHLLKEHILTALFLTNHLQLTCTYRPTWSLRRWLWNLRTTTYQTIRTHLSALTRPYIGLIFFGNKQQYNVDALRTTFNYWGLAHFLARAGLHIILFIFIWTSMLHILPIHIMYKKIILLIICVVYDLLSWQSIPFTRAFYAFGLAKVGELLGKPINSLHILTLMCLVILLYNPMQLFFLDFQLSFGLTFALILFSNLVAWHTQASARIRRA